MRGRPFLLPKAKVLTMKEDMKPTAGMGTRESENKLMKTSAGEGEGGTGMTPSMGKAVKHLNSQTGRTGKKDCDY